MKKYKIEASKNGKKYNLIFNAENDSTARNRIHKEWYSILSIKEISELNIKWNKIVFKWELNWDIKSWMIIWDDIFKIYIKLVDSLWYNLQYIYPEKEKNTSIKNKNKILKELNEQYLLYKNTNKNKINKLREKRKKEKIHNEELHLKKELNEVYKLILFILNKLKHIINWEWWYNLTIEQKDKFKIIYNEIIKLKKTTNLTKLKEIWEVALIKIWKLETDKLNKNKDDKTSILLKETNSLLKKIGSNRSFIEKRKDIKYIIKNYLLQIKYILSNLIKKKKNVKIDKKSYMYLKTILLLNKYKEILRINNKEIYKNFYLFILPIYSEKKEQIILRRRVIKQNILLLKSKVDWKVFSYTKIKKTFLSFYMNLNKKLIIFRKVSFYITILYSIIFIIYVNYLYYWSFSIYINYKWIWYFLILMWVYFSTLFSRWLISLILNFVILFFIVIFWIINF